VLKIDQRTLELLPNYAYLASSDVGIWALVYPKCPTCGAKCDKSHSGIIEFCCGHWFDPTLMQIKGLTFADVVLSVDGKPAFMFTEVE